MLIKALRLTTLICSLLLSSLSHATIITMDFVDWVGWEGYKITGTFTYDDTSLDAEGFVNYNMNEPLPDPLPDPLPVPVPIPDSGNLALSFSLFNSSGDLLDSWNITDDSDAKFQYHHGDIFVSYFEFKETYEFIATGLATPGGGVSGGLGLRLAGGDNPLDGSDTALYVTTPTSTSTPVPEPAPLALLVLGLAGIGFSRRKQRKA